VLVVDASAIVAALADDGPDGEWARSLLQAEPLATPHLMPVEAANILRRSALAGAIPGTAATLAHEDLLQLRIDMLPYEPYARRVWQLRRNLTAYDAWYVALAESLDSPLVTLDQRLAHAPGPECRFRTPSSG
jgi:predicted nucleic acid-binding protein